MAIFPSGFLKTSRAYGERQFVYSKGASVHDALLLTIMSWLLLMQHGVLIEMYCSDVSGAFGRVCSERMAQKLSTIYLNLKFMLSWLSGESLAYSKSQLEENSLEIHR